MSKKRTRRLGNNTAPVAVLVAGALGLLGLFGYGIYRSEQTAAQREQVAEMRKPNEYGCTPSMARDIPDGVERMPCKSAAHVADGTRVTYESDPPLSGEHSNRWVEPGFYSEPKQTEQLVHSLEHGHVVIYYNQDKLSAAEVKGIRDLANRYKGSWDGVVAVPRADAKHPVILTAWEHALRLESFDQARVDAFVDAFRGRGPENPVRL